MKDFSITDPIADVKLIAKYNLFNFWLLIFYENEILTLLDLLPGDFIIGFTNLFIYFFYLFNFFLLFF